MTEMNRVIKIGGSLLVDDKLAQAFYPWLGQQPAAKNVIIVGGGCFVENLREVVNRLEIDAAAAHWMSIDLMRVTARLVSKILPGLEIITDVGQLEKFLENTPEGRAGSCACRIFDPADYLREIEPTISSEPLPHSWDVTSDSIAARIADIIKADELVLLKSADPASYQTIGSAMKAGYVDAYFSIAAKKIPLVRCVNLRATPAQESVIQQ